MVKERHGSNRVDGVNPLPAVTTKGDIWSVSVKAYDGDSVSQDDLEATVVVQNSLPVLTLDELPDNLTAVNNQQDELVISPLFSDADNDPIDSSIYWLRNGFREGSLDNATTVAAAYFGAGQTWTLTIAYHDSDGPEQQFSHTLEIINIAPIANIEVLSTNLWSGEKILVDGGTSIDFDGVITNYLWEFQDSNGNSVSLSGEQVAIIGSGTIGLILTVEDDLGLIGTTTKIIQTTQGPSVTELTASNEPSGVMLDWQWSGDLVEFIIFRNGEQIGVTSELSYTDKPIIAGPTSYTITPVIEEQSLVAGSTSIADFEVAISTDSTSNISDSGGIILGIIILVSSIGLVSLGLLQRRRKVNRVIMISAMIILLGFTSFGGANPGGVGDGNFDMQCGGACHGDASQNQTSPALLELTLDSTAYLDLPVSVTAKVSGIQFSSSDKVGLFLITDTTGHSDLPEDADWMVISDQNGGANNYIELAGSSLSSEYTVSWTIKPETLQPTNFYLSIHHGSENTPFFGISDALTVNPENIPDNLPRLASDYSPAIT